MWTDGAIIRISYAIFPSNRKAFLKHSVSFPKQCLRHCDCTCFAHFHASPNHLAVESSRAVKCLGRKAQHTPFTLTKECTTGERKKNTTNNVSQANVYCPPFYVFSSHFGIACDFASANICAVLLRMGRYVFEFRSIYEVYLFASIMSFCAEETVDLLSFDKIRWQPIHFDCSNPVWKHTLEFFCSNIRFSSALPFSPLHRHRARDAAYMEWKGSICWNTISTMDLLCKSYHTFCRSISFASRWEEMHLE